MIKRKAKGETMNIQYQQEAELIALRSMCKAAAAEIDSQWKAHCNADGFGPMNLQLRLNGDIPPDIYPQFVTQRDYTRYCEIIEGALRSLRHPTRLKLFRDDEEEGGGR